MDFSNMNADQIQPMMQTFLPMFKQFYNKMDHVQSMNDFKKDDNGMFKSYFNYCDQGGDGLLTKADDDACKARMQETLMNRVKWVSNYSKWTVLKLNGLEPEDRLSP